MANEIDYPKSIIKQRLVYKMTGGVIVNYITSYFLILIFSFIGSVPILASVTGDVVPVWLLLCSLFFLIFIASSIIYRNSFVVLRGGNRQKILSVLNSFYDDLTFQVDDGKILRNINPNGGPLWGRAITVLFDGEIIYLNVSLLGKGNSPEFVFGLFNYFKARKIAKYYNSL